MGITKSVNLGRRAVVEELIKQHLKRLPFFSSLFCCIGIRTILPANSIKSSDSVGVVFSGFFNGCVWFFSITVIRSLVKIPSWDFLGVSLRFPVNLVQENVWPHVKLDLWSHKISLYLTYQDHMWSQDNRHMRSCDFPLCSLNIIVIVSGRRINIHSYMKTIYSWEFTYQTIASLLTGQSAVSWIWLDLPRLNSAHTDLPL